MNVNKTNENLILRIKSNLQKLHYGVSFVPPRLWDPVLEGVTHNLAPGGELTSVKGSLCEGHYVMLQGPSQLSSQQPCCRDIIILVLDL